ncbi:MAG: stage sporulation protein [Bacillales bacterium]|jgi:stage III sporulation protein AF|nr:stage sporulation protein [Bacillales bacterium]
MDMFMDWITNIIVFILIATVIDLILPSSSFNKYVKFVTSLLLLLMIISPVLKIFNSDIETAIENMIFNDRKNLSESLLDEKKIEILESQRAYILEQMAVQLERQVAKDVKAKYGVEISGITLESNNKELKDYKSISKVLVTYNESTSSNTKGIIEEVSPVSINVSNPITVSERSHKTDNKEIATYLSKSWGIAKAKISLKEEGGVNP